MKIGVVGLGVVGSAIRLGFERLGHHVLVHDIKLETSLTDVLPADVIYLSVPTPPKDGGDCDTTIVESVVAELALLSYKGVVAIKSTVPPGTTDSLSNAHPMMRLCFVPEFLRERYALADFMENHDLCIIGTRDTEVFSLIQNSHGKYPKRFMQLTPAEAEMAKYFNNVYNATLITFANSFYDICVASGVDYSNVKNAMIMRDHIFDRYLDCNDNFRGFGGVCLPKDLDALIAHGKKMAADPAFFENIKLQNNKYKVTAPDGMRLDHNAHT